MAQLYASEYISRHTAIRPDSPPPMMVYRAVKPHLSLRLYWCNECRSDAVFGIDLGAFEAEFRPDRVVVESKGGQLGTALSAVVCLRHVSILQLGDVDDGDVECWQTGVDVTAAGTFHCVVCWAVEARFSP